MPSSSYKLFVEFLGQSNFRFTSKMLWFSVLDILAMFCLGCGSTPRDELYGITDQSIDLDLGLYEPIGICKVSTFDL